MADQAPVKKRHRRPHASQITPDTPIWCPACQAEHPARAFNRETRKYSGLAGICREAQRIARQTPEGKAATRRRNKSRWSDPAYRHRSREWQRARYEREPGKDLRKARARLKAIVDEWKATGCVDCGYADIRAIDPDHRLPGAKVNNVSRLVTLCASEERLRAELAKCDPRCGRCHRLRTQGQRLSRWRSLTNVPPSWRHRLDLQDFNDQVKLALGCTDCGWREWARGLDWDHVRGPKEAGIATMIANRRPWLVLLAEMDKCEVVCANCHRVRTHRRRTEVSRAD
jgi:hypothetical protein